MRSAHNSWRRLPATDHRRYRPLRRPDSNRLGGERLESRRLLSLSGTDSDDDGLPKEPVTEVLPQIAALYTTYLPHGVSRSDLAAELSKQASKGGGSEAESAGSSSFVSLISVSESEPNGSIATADAVPLGFEAGEDAAVDVSGTLSSGSDDDFFSMSLQPGDIFGALVNGGATNLTFRSPTGGVLVGSGQDASFIYPVSSPLPGGGDAALAWVVDTAGTYTIAVDAGSGAYDLNLRLFRPALEAEPVFTRQILFLDFDGATIDTSIFGGSGTATLSPLSSFLGGWGLGSADESTVVDAIVASVAENFGDVAVRGNNGDFENDIVPGHYAIEIRNSRDHADPFGLANVSRVIVGGTIDEFGISTIGIAQSIDVGNFDTSESAVVLLDLLSADSSDPNSLNQYTLGAGVTIIDLVGVGVGNITAHEAGHFFANFHTDQFNASANIMDQGGNLNNTVGVGPDGIFDNGAGDDVDVDFGDDVFVPGEGFAGTEDTLNSIAFGLSTGTVSTGMIVLRTDPGDGDTVFTAPVDFVIDFLDDYDPDSVDPFDLVVANVPADSFTETDANTLTFHYNSTPVTSQGAVLLELADGSILRDSDGEPLQAYSATFRYDALLLAAVTLTPASGSTVQVPFTNLRVDFNENYDPNTAGTDDLNLSIGTVAGLTVVDGDTIDYTLSLPFAEGPLSVTMADGALTDEFGNPGAGFSASYTLDYGTVPYPLPLAGVAPLGSLIYDPAISGTIGSSDTDQFTISLDAGQTITITIVPDASLQARVEVFNPTSASAGSVTAAAAGASVALQAVTVSEPGLYTIDLSGAGGTTGQYSLQVILNALVEDEQFGGGSNDTIGTAQNLAASSIHLAGPADRLAVLGTIEAGGSQVTVHSSTDVPKAIADVDTTVSTLSIGSSAPISDVDVKIKLTHTFDADLVISLISPEGTQVLLVANRGGSGNNFTDTVFDDEASSSITSGSPPFTGTFRPEGSLSDFDGEDTAGAWTLVIEDTAGADVGTLLSWSLTITAPTASPDVYAVELVAAQRVTMALTGVDAGGTQVTPYSSADVPKAIADVDTTLSTLSIGSSASILDLDVKLDLSHTFDFDLVISLISPLGTEVLLVANEGDDGDDYTNTVFDDEASSSITNGSPPFTGNFRPEGLLSDFDGEDIAGVWTLVIEDTAGADTGTLNSWSLSVTTLAGSSVAFELQDSNGVPLAGGTSVGTNIGQVISQFEPTTSDTYFLVVTGAVGDTYSLLATRGADFDTEENGSDTVAQDLTPLSGALGSIGAIELASVNTTSAFEGLDFGDTTGFVPPDTHAAAGPLHIVEVVNAEIAIYNKTGTLLSQQHLDDFFQPAGATGPITAIPRSRAAFDPVVAYDELSERFVVASLEVDFDTEDADLLYAVSNTSNPLDGFTEMHRIAVEEFSSALQQNVWGDYPKVGWNADAHVFTLNMFGFSSGYSHVSVITIDKSTVLDANASTFTYYDVNRGNSFTMAAATMHGSVPGDPMWFVEEAGFANGAEIRVVKMTNILSNSPTFTDTNLNVDAYQFPDSATQPGSGLIETNDTRVLNSEWRNNRLVAAQAVGLAADSLAHARWYEFSTAGASPTLTQQGTIDPGGDAHTYFPSIAINAAGDLGMTYMQSSPSEFMSMYITGQASADASTTMLPAVLARAGEGTYSAFDGSPFRAGDYSGITVDPTDDRFWAVNEYATSASSENWGTFHTAFNLPSGSDEDWYELNLVAGTRLGLFTRTPGGGPLEFVNPLDPHIELVNDTGGVITGGVPLADGKNEGIAFIVPSDGIYRVRVTSQDGGLGEYVLGTGAPVITTSPGTLDYTENDAPSPIDSLLLVTDADDTDLEGATVRFTAGYAAGEDVLGFSNQAGIVGSYDPVGGVLSLTGAASVSDYQAALRSVTYENTSGNPSTAGRTVAFELNDGDSTALAALRDIMVTAADDDVSDVGFVAYWNMNEGGGTLAADTSPFGINNSGMLKFNAAFADDGLGGAVALDGFGDYVDIPDSADINLGIHGKHTVALWFNAADASLASRKQVLWEQGGTARGLNIYLFNGLLYVGGWNTSPGQSGWLGTFLSTPVTSGEWHHVALVLDGGPTLQPDVLSAYLDGALYASGTGSQVWDHGDDIGIGRVDGQSRFHTGVSGGNADGFAGFIDEVRVYSRVLLASEIASLADDLVTLQLTVTVPETTVSENGGVVTATVTRNGNLGSALIVSLSSSDTSAATVPASVTIAANEASATFDITGFNDSAADGTQTVIITASAGGFNSGTVTLDVLDDDAISTDGLVSYWSFDEGSGTVAFDTAPFGTATDGILRGNTTWSTTGLNGSLTFDGEGDFVDVPDSADVNLGIHATHSVSLWFKVTNAAITTRKQVIWEQGGVSRGMNIYVYDGQVYVGGWNTIASESNWQGTFLSAPVSSGVWHHVALVLSGGPTLQPNSLTAYLDGVEYATGDGSQVWSHGDDIGIGRQDGTTRFHDGAAAQAIDGFAGLIDEVRVYNRAITATDVDLLANSVTLTNFGLGLKGLAAADGRSGLTDPVSTAPKASDRGATLVPSDPIDPRAAIFALHALAASRDNRAGEFPDSRGGSDFDQVLSQLAWHWLYQSRNRPNGENADHTTF